MAARSRPMSKGLLARKLGMTQLFTEQGTVVSVTVLEADSCHVVQVKTPGIDGYDAVQLGFGEKKPRRTTKPEAGHFKRAGTPPSRSAASSILGSHRLPAHSRHRSTNAQYAGSNGHTLAMTVPSGDRSATAQSPTPHGTRPLAASSARTWR